MGSKRREPRGHDGSRGSSHRKPRSNHGHVAENSSAGSTSTQKAPPARQSWLSGKRLLGRGEDGDGQTGTCHSLFPAATPWIVLTVTWAIRVYYVLQPHNWWVLHPDETFQSVEVAYSELHGYGFRAYEYLPPPGHQRSRLTLVRQRELELGMFAMRSPLHPLFYVIVSKLARLLGSTTRDYVLWKVVHATVAACLPIATYKFSRVISHSHDAASVAAILTAASVHLSVLGTHTLTNSLLAPLVFFTFAVLLEAARGAARARVVTPEKDTTDSDINNKYDKGKSHKKKTDDMQRDEHEGDQDHNRSSVANGKTAADNDFSTESVGGQNGSVKRVDGDSSVEPKESRTDNSLVEGTPADCFGTTKNSECHDVREMSKELSSASGILRSLGDMVKGVTGYDAPSSCSVTHSNGISHREKNDHGDRNGHCSSAKETTETTNLKHSKESPNSAKSNAGVKKSEKASNLTNGAYATNAKSTPSTPICLREASPVDEEKICSSSSICLASLAFCLCCYIRVDLCLFAAVTIGPHVLNKRALCRLIPPCFVGALLALGIGIAGDVIFYGTFLISPYNWMKFNAFSNISAALFGAMDGDFYLREIFLNNAGLLVLCCASLVLFIAGAYRHVSNSPEAEEERRKLATAGKLLLSSVILFVFYSFKAHKEVRFLHNVFVLYFVFAAIVLTEAISVLSKARRTSQSLILVILVAFAVSQWNTFPNSGDKSNKSWVYALAHDSGDVNTCLDFISRQPDVQGVFLDKYLHSTGGYSVLGKHVPMVAAIMLEFYEFDNDSYVWIKSNKWILNSKKNFLTLFAFDCPSNFISKLNSPYLLKVLISKPEYNYLVMDTKRLFIGTGYTEVFRANDVRVLKRKFDPAEERVLREMEAGIPLGSNSTVLEYEAHWLNQYLRFELCAAKLKTAIAIDPFRPNLYKLLASCLIGQGRDDEAMQVMHKCKSRNGSRKCEEMYERVVLHPGYPRVAA